jgi:hypothetical protein
MVSGVIHWEATENDQGPVGIKGELKMSPKRRGAATLAAVLALVLMTAGVAIAANHLEKRIQVTVKPGKDPNDLSGKQKAPGGTPSPDALRASDPKNCRADRFEGRKGTKLLYAYLERWWPRGENGGYGGPSCRTSLHDEGRAIDFSLNAANKGDRRAANQIVHFFLNRDTNGVKYAMARRFGVQELIWNCHIWTSSRASEGWRYYDRYCPTSDDALAHRNHVHVGQNWPGARAKTSAYKGWTFFEQP